MHAVDFLRCCIAWHVPAIVDWQMELVRIGQEWGCIFFFLFALWRATMRYECTRILRIMRIIGARNLARYMYALSVFKDSGGESALIVAYSWRRIVTCES